MALAISLALAASLLGGGGSANEPLDIPSISTSTFVEMPDLTTPPLKVGPRAPRTVTVVVPSDVDFNPGETVASTVTLPPPPPPPPPPPTPVFDVGAAVARAISAPNGQIPADALCGLSWDASALLRCDAAQALEAAAGAGMPTVAITSTYRSYADQVAVKAERGRFAATPGTSNHGHGVAIDMPEPARSWLHRYGAAYGWHNPAWAKDPARLEVWHFEYTG